MARRMRSRLLLPVGLALTLAFGIGALVFNNPWFAVASGVPFFIAVMASFASDYLRVRDENKKHKPPPDGPIAGRIGPRD